MKSICEKERIVLQALKSGEWTEALRQHAEQCEECRKTVRLFPWIQNLSVETEKEASLPNYRWIMMQAEWRREQSENQKFKRWYTYTIAAMVAACAALVTWFFSPQGYSLDSLIKGIQKLDFSYALVLIAILVLSDLQFRFFLKTRIHREAL